MNAIPRKRNHEERITDNHWQIPQRKLFFKFLRTFLPLDTPPLAARFCDMSDTRLQQSIWLVIGRTCRVPEAGKKEQIKNRIPANGRGRGAESLQGDQRK